MIGSTICPNCGYEIVSHTLPIDTCPKCGTYIGGHGIGGVWAR